MISRGLGTPTSVTVIKCLGIGFQVKILIRNGTNLSSEISFVTNRMKDKSRLMERLASEDTYIFSGKSSGKTTTQHFDDIKDDTLIYFGHFSSNW